MADFDAESRSIEDLVKEAWLAVLQGDHAALRNWVAGCEDWSVPLTDEKYRLLPNGHVVLGKFLTQVYQVISRSPTPAQQMLIEHFALRGVFFPRDLPSGVSADQSADDAKQVDFSALLVRLAKCNLLFRSASVSGQLLHSLSALLPHETESPFHHFMVRHCLKNGLSSLLEAYVIWYGLHKVPFDLFFAPYQKAGLATGLFPVDLFRATPASALQQLDRSRVVRAGSQAAAMSGQAVLAAALTFPAQPSALRRQVYSALLEAYAGHPELSSERALVESVVTGDVAARRRALEEELQLSDPSTHALSVREVRSICRGLVQVLDTDGRLPCQPDEERLHGAWLPAADLFSSVRDISLFAILGQYFQSHFPDQSINVESVFASYPPSAMLEMQSLDWVGADCELEHKSSLIIQDLRHLLIIGRPLQAFDVFFRYLLGLVPGIAAAAVNVNVVDVESSSSSSSSSSFSSSSSSSSTSPSASSSPSAVSVFQQRAVALMFQHVVDLAHKTALSNAAQPEVVHACLIFVDLMDRLASARAAAAAGVGADGDVAGIFTAASSRQMTRLAFLVEIAKVLGNASAIVRLSEHDVAELLFRVHLENRELSLAAQRHALSAAAPVFAFFDRAPLARRIMAALREVHAFRQDQPRDAVPVSQVGQVSQGDADEVLRLLLAASLVFNQPFDPRVGALARSSSDSGQGLLRWLLALAEALDTPAHFFLAHLAQPGALAVLGSRQAPLLERVTLAVGATLGLAVGPNAPAAHPWHQPGAQLRVEPSAAWLHRLSLALAFAADQRADVTLQLVPDTLPGQAADGASTLTPTGAAREAGALMLLHVLEQAAAGAPGVDSVLPSLALHYPGATRLDAFLTWLRCSCPALKPLPARTLLADQVYAHPYADLSVQPGRLFNPGYLPELLTELVDLQQFTLILRGLDLFYPNASLAHFVRFLAAVTRDQPAEARSHLVEFVRVQKLTALYGAAAASAAAHDDLQLAADADADAERKYDDDNDEQPEVDQLLGEAAEEAGVRQQRLAAVTEQLLAGEDVLESGANLTTAANLERLRRQRAGRVSAAQALGPHVHFFAGDAAHTAGVARRLLNTLRHKRSMRSKYLAALLTHLLRGSGFDQIEFEEVPEDSESQAGDDTSSVSQAPTDVTGLRLIKGNIKPVAGGPRSHVSGATGVSSTSSRGGGALLPERLWSEKLQQFREFQKSFLYQFSAERINFCDEARCYFAEHRVSPLLAGCFFYRVLFASLRAPFDEQLHIVGILLELWDNQPLGALTELWHNLHGLRCWLRLLMSPPAGAVRDASSAPSEPVMLPADRTRGLYLLDAPDESAYLPRPRARELNAVLVEAVLHRLLNDHRFNEASRLIAELQLYSLTLTASLAALLDLLPVLFYLAGFPFDQDLFPPPQDVPTMLAAARERAEALAAHRAREQAQQAAAAAQAQQPLVVDPAGRVVLTAAALQRVQQEEERAQSDVRAALAAAAALASQPVGAAKKGGKGGKGKRSRSANLAVEAELDAQAASLGYFAIDGRDWLGAFLRSIQAREVLRLLQLQTVEEEEAERLERAERVASSWTSSLAAVMSGTRKPDALSVAASMKEQRAPFLQRLVKAFAEQSLTGRVLTSHAGIKVLSPAIALPGAPPSEAELIGSRLDALCNLSSFSWNADALADLSGWGSASVATQQQGDQATAHGQDEASAPVLLFDSKGFELPISWSQRSAIFARALQAFPGVRPFVESLSLIAELRFDLMPEARLDAFDIFVQFHQPHASDVLMTALARVIDQSGFFARAEAEAQQVDAAEQAALRAASLKDKAAAAQALVQVQSQGQQARGAPGAIQPHPDRLRRLLGQLQRLGLLSAQQAAEALDKALRTFLFASAPEQRPRMLASWWDRPTFLAFVRTIEGHDLRALSLLGHQLFRSGVDFDARVRSEARKANLVFAAEAADKDAQLELWLAAYFAFAAAGDAQGLHALLSHVDAATPLLRQDRLVRFLRLTGEFDALPQMLGSLLALGAEGARLLAREVIPADPLYPSRLRSAMHVLCAQQGPERLQGAFQQEHVHVPHLERAWRLQNALHAASAVLQGAERFFHMEEMVYALTNLAKTSRADDRFNEFLSLAAAASLVQLEMALEPARLRSRFNFTSPSPAQFDDIWAHYSATPTDASALPQPAANLPSPSDPNPAPDRLLTVTAALLQTEAARAPTKLQMRAAAAGEAYLTKAQTLRLVADTVLSSLEAVQVLAIWKEVADKKRERLLENNLTVFWELRGRIEQMVRAMLQQLRPASDARAYVRKSDLLAVMVPKVAAKVEVAEAIAQIAADQQVARGDAVVPPDSLLFFGAAPFQRKQLHAQVSALELDDIWQRLSRREREVVQRFYANHCNDAIAHLFAL